MSFLFVLLIWACSADDRPEVTPLPDPPEYAQYGTPIDEVPDAEEAVVDELNWRAFISRIKNKVELPVT